MDNRTLFDFVKDNEMRVKGGARYDVLRSLNNYIHDEWGDMMPDVDLDHLDSVGVMYSTCDVEYDEYEQGLQVMLNMSTLPATLSVYLEGHETDPDDYIEREYYNTWADLKEEVDSWDFDCLYSWAVHKFRDYERANGLRAEDE